MSVAINTSAIRVDDRVRKDFGDIDELANSIRENGLIQPIVLTSDMGGLNIRLVAGERRFRALKRLGLTELLEGKHYIWRNGDDLRLKAMEMEENIRRKDLSWQEQVAGKKRLLELMQQIHGEPKMGRGNTGFGVRKLATMLGENVATVSKDLRLASTVETLPSLAAADTKEAALRQVKILGAVAEMTLLGQQRATDPASEAAPGSRLWTLHEGDFNDNKNEIGDETVDLVYTDLPFGVDLSKMSKHGPSGAVGYSDARGDIVRQLEGLANTSYRILRVGRFAVFFFGFNYYTELCGALQTAGFSVNPVPLVWYKHTRSTENPNTRYANAYDPAIVAMKGTPVFIKPGQANVVDLLPVKPNDRLQIAQQPVELVEKFIKDMTSEGATVVDFMAGSGTTGVAAVKNKRAVIMFERDPKACTVIKARMEAL